MIKRDKGKVNFVPRDARGKNLKNINILGFYLAEDEATTTFQGERRWHGRCISSATVKASRKFASRTRARRGLREGQCLRSYGGSERKSAPRDASREAPRREKEVYR